MGPASRERLLSPRRKASEKPGALSGHQRLIRQYGVAPLIYQYGETVTAQTREDGLLAPYGIPWLLKMPHAQRPVENLSFVAAPIPLWQSLCAYHGSRPRVFRH